MVQMKVSFYNLKYLVCQLYIPHGSDESYFHPEFLDWKEDTLYPTWFR